MAIDDSAAQDALDRLIANLEPATARVSLKMAEAVQTRARGNLEDPIGPLAESILTTGPDLVGSAAYRTHVGPTLIYGRQRELGGPINPLNPSSLLTAHYRSPGYWTWEGSDVFTSHVFQVGQHYLHRGVSDAMPEMLAVCIDVWSDALKAAV